MRIEDLAVAMIQLLAPKYDRDPDEISINEIGTKPGEKLYEELMSYEELRRTLELKNYFSVLPAFRGIYQDINYDYKGIVSKEVTNPYTSEYQKPLTVKEIQKFLEKYNLLGSPLEQSENRYWPGDKK